MRKYFSDVNSQNNNVPGKYDITLPDNNNITLLIDSKDRDKKRFPTQDKYSIVLNSGYRDVISIELVSARIPTSGTNINPTNCTIAWSTSGTGYSAEIVPGQYDTAVDIMTELIAAMNVESGVHNHFSYDIAKYTNKVTISGTQPFTLIFEGDSFRTSNDFSIDESGNKTYVGNYTTKYIANSIGYILGFSAQNYVSDITNSVVSDFRILRKNNNYVSLFLNKRMQFGHVDSSNITTSGCFCVLEEDTNNSGWYTYSKNISYPNIRYVKYFNEPIPNLALLEFEFVDYNGNRYNFNNQDHMLTFEIRSLTRKN